MELRKIHSRKSQGLAINSGKEHAYISMKTIRGIFYGGEIHCLRRLSREGSPERFRRSWQLVHRNIAPFE